jgi:hypothetical protein
VAASQGAAILSQIEGLLEQYLALGQDTPFYAQADQMLSQLKPVLGRGAGPDAGAPADAGAMPAGGDLLGDAETSEPLGPPDEGAAEPPADFESARSGAKAMLERTNAEDAGLDNLKRKKKAKAR